MITDPWEFLSLSLIVGFIVFIAVLFLPIWSVVFNDASVYYYLFSSIIQGSLSLIAFIGLAVVFQLQEIFMSKRNQSNEDKETEGDIRKSMMILTTLSFLNIFASMIFLILTPYYLKNNLCYGILSISFTIGFSAVILLYAWWIVRRTIYWSKY